MYLDIKSGFTFREVFAPIEKIVAKCKPYGFCGIADKNNTFSHVPLEIACQKEEIKPFFGVSLPFVFDLEEKDRRGHLNHVKLIALSNKGLKSIYEGVELAYKQHWHTPRLSYNQIDMFNQNEVLIISGFAFPKRIRSGMIPHQEVSQGFPQSGIFDDRIKIACINNNYIDKKDEINFEIFADDTKQLGIHRQTYPQWILNHDEHFKYCGDKKAIKNLLKIVKKSETVKLQKAPLVKFDTKSPKALVEKKAIAGAKRLGINLKKGKYKKRYDKELAIIEEKGFLDYFLLIEYLVSEAKKQNILVGPGRGSSGGSLVAYLIGIVLVDPIKYGLVFERFIDINRTDLPDVDLDFPPDQIDKVFKILAKKFYITKIGNVSTLTPKENLNRASRHLHIPQFDLTSLKNLIPDTKADAIPMKELLKKTEEGNDVLKKHPILKHTIPLDNHPLHSSTHAGGIIVSNDHLSSYFSTNNRESANVAQLDMKGCEHLNLLKVDALKLSTLSVLAKTLDLLNLPHDFLYNLPDGNKKAYKLLNSEEQTGNFQMEGRIIKQINKGMNHKEVPTLGIISALGRPGPMKAGSMKRYAKRRNGAKFEYVDNHKSFKKITKETYGVIVYQEQIMQIAREYAKMEWPDVITLRKVVAKSKGTEELKKFREKFMKGAKGNNPEGVWDQIKTFGSYGFVKAHAIAYGVITYWCAYLKANHLLEFAVSLLNVTNDENKCIEILRYLKEVEGVKHKEHSLKHSGLEWKVHKGKVLGPLTAIHGIGIQNARSIMKCNRENLPYPDGIQTKIDQDINPFRYIYPRKQLYSDYKGTNIENINKKGKFTIVAKLIKLKLKDANSVENIANRNGNLKEGPTTYINLIVADDTKSLMCHLNRFDYEKIGEAISNDSEENKTWFQIKGEFHPDMEILFINKIKDITK